MLFMHMSRLLVRTLSRGSRHLVSPHYISCCSRIRYASAKPAAVNSEPTKPNPPRAQKWFKADEEGKPSVEFSFVEEPLGLATDDGCGWPDFQFEEAIGPEARYVLKRKLGWGAESSVWLARDLKNDNYVAIKALTGYYTRFIKRGDLFEPDALQQLTSSPLGPLSALHQTARRIYPPRARFWRTHLPGHSPLLHVLRGVAHAHRCGYVHTDLKHDNVFFDTSLSTEEIDRLLARDPPRRHPPERSVTGMVQVAVSQPLPMISMEEAMKRTFLISDFGRAEPVSRPEPSKNKLVKEISPIGLRAPELWLGGPWNKEIDIWIFGVLAYEFITADRLFQFGFNEKFDLNPVENMLYQMILFSKDDFLADQLNASSKAATYFESNCRLKKDPTIFDVDIEVFFKECSAIESDKDIKATADFVRRCLKLNPQNRPTAEELLKDPWFDDVE
ncbi:hypothetical protein AX16_004633 [Volvariella volvacea WC 439]|nr:hypothetical protein AX16_004633 [Volvariella volvacea WC 439]